jgi:hypothetical protein
MKKRVVVIIPIYKELDGLFDYERVSIINTINRLSMNYEIGFLTHSKNIFKSYIDAFDIQKKKIKLFETDKKHFQNIHTYNTLLKSSEFYGMFSKYDFLLIAQTDCYVFQSDLSPFFKYDYIGAPWFYDILHPNIKGLFCGNGGLSLRNVQKCYDISKSNKHLIRLRLMYNLVKPYFDNQYFILAYFVALKQYWLSNRSFNNKNYYIFEDVYWSRVIPQSFNYFKIPNGEEALRFSFETYPDRCFELNNYELPFGCHGFNKYNMEFWRRYITFK